ncbi:MAG: molecular chaperone HtpG, partial [Bacteroidota bacterium]
FMGTMPEKYNLVVNSNHPKIGKLLLNPDGGKQAEIVKQLFDLAMLAQNQLKGKDLSDFIKRNIESL